MDKIKVKCIGMDKEGKGIVKIDDKELHISNLITGEAATIEIYNKKNMLTKVVKIEEKSKDRVTPNCKHFEQCGGCQLQHLSINGQSKFKQDVVEKLMKKYHRVNPIISMDDPYFYRNKIHSTLSFDKTGKIISGIYQENTHRITPIEACQIQDSRADKIIESVKEIMKKYKMKPYDEDKKEGFLRHILIKTGFVSGEVMVVLVTSSQIFTGKNNFVDILLKKHPEITTIIMNVNNKSTSMILGDTEKVLYGKGYIEDTLCGRVFQISSKSFYQINPIQTEKLYNKAIDMARLSGEETIIDAYCGIGTIGIIASSRAKSVIGVELNKEAVNDAIRNAKRNDIKNINFYNEDAGDFMIKLAQQKQKVDTVFMDPPRSGSDEKFLNSLIKLSPKRIVYISCNPVTQERDIKTLIKSGYNVDEIQPVDMFPQTYHVENIISLYKKTSK